MHRDVGFVGIGNAAVEYVDDVVFLFKSCEKTLLLHQDMALKNPADMDNVILRQHRVLVLNERHQPCGIKNPNFGALRLLGSVSAHIHDCRTNGYVPVGIISNPITDEITFRPRLCNWVTVEVGAGNRDNMPIVINSCVGILRFAHRLRLYGKDPGWSNYDMVDVEAICKEIVVNQESVGAQLLQLLTDGSLSVPPKAQIFILLGKSKKSYSATGYNCNCKNNRK